MSELAREFFAENPFIAGPTIAIVLFTAVFLIAVLRAARMSRQEVERMSNLVFDGARPSEGASEEDSDE